MSSATASAAAVAAPRRAVVLVNIGTPEAPTVPAVRKFLAEFLGDPYVVDLPAPARWMLLNFIILPFRPRRSAHAYQQIWTDAGSPLLLHSRAQAEALQRLLPDREVVLAMRYGKPSLSEVLESLRTRGVEQVTLVPLYPQHASATTVTTVEHARKHAQGMSLSVVPAFHAAAGFVEAGAERLRAAVAGHRAEHVLFSYHGLPVRQLTPHCDRPCGSGACGALRDGNRDCYRAQCFATSEALARAAGITSSTTTFQSRLKGATWMSPYTDETVVALAQQGVKRLVVACPAFVADCLETLEEIGQRASESFRAAGGEMLALVPAVNDSPAFIQALADEIQRRSP